MMDPHRNDAGCSEQRDEPVPYMLRTRLYYAALGYDVPYRWASMSEVPWAGPCTMLAQCCIALVTTAALFDPANGEQGPGAPYNGAAKFGAVYSAPVASRPDLRIAHLAYDRAHTTASDPRSYNPLAALQAAAARGRIGQVAPRLHGLPTSRSHRATLHTDAPELLRRCREDGADAVILVANCPVCHQSASLAACHIERAGIPTVVMGAARDIVEHCGVPRFCFTDFPLGNAAGKPHDPASQAATLELALRLLEAAPGPRTTVQSPQRWAPDAAWKRDYGRTDHLAPADIARLRAGFDREKQAARQALRPAADH